MTQFQAIMLALDAAERLTRLVVSMVHRAKVREELTAEQETVIRTRQSQIMAMNHWQIDPDPQ
jgi:hypothetical protein